MDIYFKKKKDAILYNSEKELKKKWPPQVAQTIMQRLTQLDGADNLSHISNYPPMRLHKLYHNRVDQFAVDINSKLRLTFEVANDPIPKLKDGGIDKTKVTEILILGVENYHGE